MFFGFSNESIFSRQSLKDTKNVVNAYNFPKLFVSLQPIYTEIKPNKMAEESNNEFHNVVPLQIRFVINIEAK